MVTESRIPRIADELAARALNPGISGKLIDQLRAVEARCPKQTSLDEMPIRTIHHLSCTGGTLFTKCIAAMPNTVVLNEINPFSKIMIPKGKPPFTPTDMVALVRQGDRSLADHDTIKELFLDNLAVLRRKCWLTGRVLVLRDHSHSQFLHGEMDEAMPTLRDIVAERFPVVSVVTTRQPENAFASMEKQGWHRHFAPATFEEYERRVRQFEARFGETEMFSYEKLTRNPGKVIKALCKALDLDFSSDFEQTFHAFRFSGDSGRGGKTIVCRD